MAVSVRRFKPYPAYKDSGVEWLEEIPGHWRVLALKRIGSLKAGAGFPDDEQGLMTEEIPFFKVGDMGVSGNEREMRECQHTVSIATARRLRAFIFPPGTIVFAKVGAALLLNRRRLLARLSCIDNNMMGFMAGDCDPSWAMYWLIGLDMGELANPGAVPSVNEGQMRDTPALLPSEPEQRAIAAFLDRETARIDALVAKKERLIGLLQEKRTALITRAVTEGLDPNAPMKDSGVEWLGKIPAHWDIIPIGAIADSLVGFAFPSEDFSFEEGTRLVRGDNVTTEALRWGDKTRAWLKPAPHPRYYLMEEDIVIGMDGSKVGRNYAMVRQEDLPLLLVQRVTRLRARPIILPGFLFWSIAGPRFHAHVDTCKSDPAIPHITLKNIESFPIAVPSTEEQFVILDHILKVGGKLTTLLEAVEDAVDRLKELRTALISAAVTGKFDVREEVG